MNNEMNDLDFLMDFNGSLEGLEDRLVKSLGDSDLPNIYILGLPRSGTTLLYQILSTTLDIKSPNNLIARFWDTPLVGFKLSEIVLNNLKSHTYISNYGQTTEISSPHEFTYFWHKLLKINNIEDMNCSENNMSCEEWQLVHKKIQSINALVNKPVVYKPLELITYRLEEYLEVLPNSFFIYIERDIQDIACSIAKGRLAINKTLDKWWSSYPYEYKELRNKEWQDQIAGQVYYLKKMYDNQLQKIEPKNFIKINYKNFCNDTDGVIKTIVSKIESATRYKIKYGSVNTVLKETKPKVPNPIRIELEAALKRVYLNG